MAYHIKDGVIVIQNENIILELSPYGASVHKLYTKDRKGVFKNIIVSHQNVRDNTDNEKQQYGCNVGPHYGKCKSTINEVGVSEYNSDKCNNTMVDVFSKCMWSFDIEQLDIGVCCVFRHSFKKDESGLASDINVTITYYIENNQLSVKHHVTSNEVDVINMSNPLAFNLSGNFNKSVAEDILIIDSIRIAFNDAEGLFTDIGLINNTELDFMKKKKLSELSSISRFNKNFDYMYLINKYDRNTLIMHNLECGRLIKIKTDYPAMYISTSCLKDDEIIDYGIKLKKFRYLSIALCHLPKAVGNTKIGQVTPDKPYAREVNYTFETK